MPAPTNLGFLGIIKETVKGTGQAPTSFIPIPISRVWQDVITPLDDVGIRGSMVDGPYDQIQGPIHSTFQIPDGPAFGDSSLPWWVLGILGDVTNLASRTVADAVTNSSTTITSATAAFTQNDVGRPISTPDFPVGAWIVSVTNATTAIINVTATAAHAAQSLTVGAASLVSHIGSLKNSGDGQCTSYTLTDYYGLTGGTPARQFPGCQVDQVTVKFTGDGLLVVGANLTGFPSAVVAKPTPSYSTVTEHPGWENFVTIAGAGSPILVSGELTFKRNTKPINTSDGTQAPYKIWQPGLSLSGKIAVVGEDETQLQHYLTNDKPPITFDFRHGTNSTLISSRFEMSKVNYLTGAPNHGGDFLAWDIGLTALPNSSDAGASGGVSHCKAKFQNQIVAGTFQ